MIGTLSEQTPPHTGYAVHNHACAEVLTLLSPIPRVAGLPRPATGDSPRHVGRGVPVTWTLSPRMAERRARMRDVGARLFARLGVNGAAILDVAREANVPVSPAAHGYRRRPDLVFDILHAYLDALHEYVGVADDEHQESAPEVRVVAVIAALLDGIHDHADAHQVMLATFPTLPDHQREALRYVIRTLAYRLAGPLEAVVPTLSIRRELQAPLVHSLLGMASHAPFWLKADGPLTRDAYAGLIAKAMVAAARDLAAEAR